MVFECPSAGWWEGVGCHEVLFVGILRNEREEWEYRGSEVGDSKERVD